MSFASLLWEWRLVASRGPPLLTAQDPSYTESLTGWAFPFLGCSCSWQAHHVMSQPTPFLCAVDVNVSYLQLRSASLHLSPLLWGLRSGVWNHCPEQVCPHVRGGRCPWPVRITVHILETVSFPAEHLQSPRDVPFPPAPPTLARPSLSPEVGARLCSACLCPGVWPHLRPPAVGSCCPLLSSSRADCRFKPNPGGFICPAVPFIPAAPLLLGLSGLSPALR